MNAVNAMANAVQSLPNPSGTVHGAWLVCAAAMLVVGGLAWLAGRD